MCCGSLSEATAAAIPGAELRSEDVEELSLEGEIKTVVANGVSELLGEGFGEAGRHARSAVGVAVLPLDAPVEVELVDVERFGEFLACTTYPKCKGTREVPAELLETIA